MKRHRNHIIGCALIVAMMLSAGISAEEDTEAHYKAKAAEWLEKSEAHDVAGGARRDVYTSGVHATYYWMLGNNAKAAEHMKQCDAASRAVADPDFRRYAMSVLAANYMTMGQKDKAQATLDAIDIPALRGHAHSLHAWQAVTSGMFDEKNLDPILDRAAGEVKKIGRVRGDHTINLGVAYMHRNRFDRVDALAEQSVPPTQAYYYYGCVAGHCNDEYQAKPKARYIELARKAYRNTPPASRYPHEQVRYAQALIGSDHHEEGLALYKSLKGNDDLAAVELAVTLATDLHDEGETDQAIAQLKSAITACRQVEPEDDQGDLVSSYLWSYIGAACILLEQEDMLNKLFNATEDHRVRIALCEGAVSHYMGKLVNARLEKRYGKTTSPETESKAPTP